MRIFVTGASGFIGQAFCREAVRRGHQILALTRNPVQLIPLNVEIAEGSLGETPWDQVASFSPDSVLHLAWIAEPGVYLQSPQNEVWLEQSKLWFGELIKMKIPHIAGVGTCIEYAASNDPLDEGSSLLAPQYPYSIAKRELYEWIKTHTPIGSRWCWLRVFYPYGPGEHSNRICTALIRQLSTRTPISLRTPHSVKDYIYIDDLAEAICMTLEAKILGAVNLGSGEGVSIFELAKMTTALLKADSSLVQIASDPIIDPTPHVVASIGRLRSLGWKSSTRIEEGLQKLLASILASKGLVD